MNYPSSHAVSFRADLLAALFFLAGAAVLIQGALTALAAAPAGSYTPPEQGTSPALAPSAGALATSSLNWSGYVASAGRYTAVSGAWTVPHIDTSDNRSIAADATWIGIGGVTQTDLIQAGTQAVSDAEGDIVYEPWIETIPGDSFAIPMPISPGDAVGVAISNTGKDVWTITFNDNTTGGSYHTTITHHSTLSSAEWIEEMPSSARGNYFIPLDNFGSVTFSAGSTVDSGFTKSIAGSGAQALSMKSVFGDTLADTGVLSAAGESFTVERTRAAPPAGLTRRHSFIVLQL